MKLKVVSCDGVAAMVENLMREAKVVAPHKREGYRQWSFAEVTDPEKICLQYGTTTLPPKKYAFPTVEPIVRYEMGPKPHAEPIIESEPLVLFGVHPCDIYGFTALDTAYTDHNVDPNWLARRRQMRIVGVDCTPDEFCFCAAMGTASVDTGYDIFLTPFECDYVAEVGTEAGEQMLEGIATRDATAVEVAQLKKLLNKKMQQERKINCEVSMLPLHFAGVYHSKLWEKHGERCYSCGSCNMACPTCFCFDVEDRVEIGLDRGERVRMWDACMLEPFAEVASGENFRETRFARLRHRYYRKYAYLFTRYGKPYCCGCGRCVRQCLVHIDPVEILNDVVAESQKGASAHGA